MADTKHNGIWMVSILLLLGALAYIALRPAPGAPTPAQASGASAALAPAAPASELGPLGPFAQAAQPAPGALADWTMEGQNPGRTRFGATPIRLPLTQRRAVQMPADREAGSPPVIASGLMLVETKDHLRAIDLRSGKERWAYGNPGAYISPAVAGGRAYLRAESNNTGRLVALDLLSGTEVWQFTPRRLSSEVNSYFGGHLGSPVIAEGAVFVGAGKELYALDAATGKTRWEFAAQDFVTSSATVAGGRVFISDFKFVYGIDQASGALLWTYPANSAISFSAVATDDMVLVTSGEKVAALGAADGTVRWELARPGEKLIPAAITDELAFVKSTERLYALRLSDGREVWQFHDINFVSLPAVAGGQVFLVQGMGGATAVVALDSGSGRELWKQPLRSLATTAPVIAGGAIYVRMEDGRVLGLWG